MKKTVVIGGGPAGMMAAARLNARGKEVILIEKNAMLGKKLRITGKGRCNITNACDISDVFENIPRNARFLYSAIYSFTNSDMIALMESLGVPVKVERGMRVFPASDSAHDVAKALERYALGENVQLLRAEAEHIVYKNGSVSAVVLKSGRKIECDSVIVATGGASYPLTGSTGDGYRFAQEGGHTVVEPKPSLVPLKIRDGWIKSLMGLSLKNVEIKITDEKGKKVFTDFGEMLFTHFGISGPIVLSASAHMRDLDKQHYTVHIDLKPALTHEQLDKRILRDFSQIQNKLLVNALDALLPKKLIEPFLESIKLDKHKSVNQISKEERKVLVEGLKDIRLEVKGFRPLSEAIVTSGGVHVKEINPSTMESKLVKGLYFAGEVIDADAYTGGFNLQIAYSTGYLAGENA